MNTLHLPLTETPQESLTTESTTEQAPSKSRNRRFESLRESLKNDLFAKPSFYSPDSTSTQQEAFTFTPARKISEDLDTKKNSDSSSPFNSRLDKYRNSVKGNLIMLSQNKPSFSPDNMSSSSDKFSSLSETVITPVELGHSKSPLLQCHQISQAIEESSGEETPDGRKEKDNGEGFDVVEEEENVSWGMGHQNRFMAKGVNEVERLKDELCLEDYSDVHFIEGDFFRYYQEGKVLGEGTSGIVKKCKKVPTNETFAVKVVQYRGDNEALTLMILEFQNLKKLNHKNIIKVYELYVDYYKKKIYSVMELAECKEMFEVLEDLGHYSEAVASGIFRQILKGINYLHSHGVCHRDIKPNNILVSKDGNIVKIADFNVSKFDKTTEKYTSLSTENQKMWTYTGTIAFTAPEVFNDSEYSEIVDVWSAGVVLYTMLCGYQPFQADYVEELIEQIKTGKYELDEEHWGGISEQAKDLMKHCLDINPKTRYTPAQALMHPWIANEGKVSDTKISKFSENFRVYFKKYADKKKQANGAEMKKMQVTSPNMAVMSPFVDRVKKRAGTVKLFQSYLRNKMASPKLVAVDRNIQTMEGKSNFANPDDKEDETVMVEDLDLLKKIPLDEDLVQENDERKNELGKIGENSPIREGSEEETP